MLFLHGRARAQKIIVKASGDFVEIEGPISAADLEKIRRLFLNLDKVAPDRTETRDDITVTSFATGRSVTR